jgi:hypothetical protein
MNTPIYALLNIRLQPGAKEDALCDWMDNGVLKVRVKSKPIEGKANKNLIKLLSKQLKVPKSSIEITKGEKSKNKTIKMWGIDQGELKIKLDRLLDQEP